MRNKTIDLRKSKTKTNYSFFAGIAYVFLMAGIIYVGVNESRAYFREELQSQIVVKTKTEYIEQKVDGLKLYSRAQVRQRIEEKGKEAGLTADQIEELKNLSCCESRHNQFFTLHNSDAKRSIDRGIFALNDKWKFYISNDQAFNVDSSIDYTIKNYFKMKDQWLCSKYMKDYKTPIECLQ